MGLNIIWVRIHNIWYQTNKHLPCCYTISLISLMWKCPIASNSNYWFARRCKITSLCAYPIVVKCRVSWLLIVSAPHITVKGLYPCREFEGTLNILISYTSCIWWIFLLLCSSWEIHNHIISHLRNVVTGKLKVNVICTIFSKYIILR